MSNRAEVYEYEFVTFFPDSLIWPGYHLLFRDLHLLDCWDVKICAAYIGSRPDQIYRATN